MLYKGIGLRVNSSDVSEMVGVLNFRVIGGWTTKH